MPTGLVPQPAFLLLVVLCVDWVMNHANEMTHDAMFAFRWCLLEVAPILTCFDGMNGAVGLQTLPEMLS